MTEPLFDPEKCDVENVPKLDFNFVQDCTIAEPPPPIYDCQPPSVPREPPPPGCPQFQDNTVNVDTFFKTCTIKETGFATAGTTYSLIDSAKNWSTNTWTGHYLNIVAGTGFGALPIKILSNLNTTLNFEIAQTFIPDATTEYEILDRVAGGEFIITQTDVDPCKFALDLELQIPFPEPPCPEFSVTGTINYGPEVSAAGVSLEVSQSYISGPDCTTPPTCQVDLNLDLQIPTPPCPAFSGSVAVAMYAEACAIKDSGIADSGTTTSLTDIASPPKNWATNQWANYYLRVVRGTGHSANYIKIASNTGDTLTFVVAQAFIADATTEYEILDQAPQGEIVVTKTNSDPCEFALDLDLALPIPEPICPVFNTTASALLSTTVATAGISFDITPVVSADISGTCDEKRPCEYDVNVDIQIPQTPCPVISGAIFVHSADDYTGAITITPTPQEGPNTACQFAVDLDIGIPQTPTPPCPDITGTVNLTSSGTPSAALSITPTAPAAPTDPCAYAITLDLDIPTPCVPNIDVTAAIACVNGANSPIFETAVTKGATGCDYLIDLNVELPPIRPCPVITSSLSLKTGDLAGALTVSKTTPTNATAACSYSVDLDLYIPTACTTSISTTGSIQYGDAWDPSMQFTATKSASGCHYDLVLDIDLPPYPACPEFSGDVSVYESTQPTGSITFTPYPPTTPGQPCTYDVNVAIAYTKNKLQKGTVTCAFTVCGVEPTCDMTIHAPDIYGIQYVDLDIRIPRPPSYTGAVLKLVDANNTVYGTGYISVDQSGCTRAVSGAITLNTTSCTSSSGP
jgi:hypothetical protein